MGHASAARSNLQKSCCVAWAPIPAAPIWSNWHRQYQLGHTFAIRTTNRKGVNMLIPRWDQLRALGGGFVAKSVSTLPVLSIALYYLPEVQSFLSEKISPFFANPPILLLVFFYGTVLFAIGTVVFTISAPPITRKYLDDVEYARQEKDFYWADEEKYIAKRIPHTSRHYPTRQEGQPFNRIEVMRKYYRYLAESRPGLRAIVSFIFFTGLALIVAPVVIRIYTITLRLAGAA